MSKPLEEKSELTKNAYISSITPKVKEIMRKKLAGQSNVDIAKAVGLSDTRVSFIVSSPLFKEEMQKKQDSIDKRFEEELALDPVKRKFHKATEAAADVIIGAMNNEDANLKVRVDTANDVLAYDGYTKKPQEDHSTKILVTGDIFKNLNVAMKVFNIDTNLLKQAGMENIVEQIETEYRDKPESISGTGEEKFLDILQGDNGE